MEILRRVSYLTSQCDRMRFFVAIRTGRICLDLLFLSKMLTLLMYPPSYKYQRNLSFIATSTHKCLNFFSIFAKVQNPFSNICRSSKSLIKSQKACITSIILQKCSHRRRAKRKVRGDDVKREQRKMNEKGHSILSV